MRISDWSSDVCSSDLNDHAARDPLRDGEAVCAAKDRALQPRVTRWGEGPDLPSDPFETPLPDRRAAAAPNERGLPHLVHSQARRGRPAERRVGQGGGRTCNCVWARDHKKKKKL